MTFYHCPDHWLIIYSNRDNLNLMLEKYGNQVGTSFVTNFYTESRVRKSYNRVFCAEDEGFYHILEPGEIFWFLEKELFLHSSCGPVWGWKVLGKRNIGWIWMLDLDCEFLKRVE